MLYFVVSARVKFWVGWGMKQHLSTILMGAFIGGVIIAGLFGPYMISVFLMLLVAACVARFGVRADMRDTTRR